MQKQLLVVSIVIADNIRDGRRLSQAKPCPWPAMDECDIVVEPESERMCLIGSTVTRSMIVTPPTFRTIPSGNRHPSTASLRHQHQS